MRPLVIADGGASAEAPGHTIAAFETALAEGADALGMRVRLSRDGHPVVFGPATLDRASDGSGPVEECTVRELKRLDAGGWKAPRFGGQRIQTLPEVLERFRDRTRFWIEVPGGGEDHGLIEERVVSTIEIYDAVEVCLVQSADRRTLGRVRALNPDLRLAARWTAGPIGGALPQPGEAEAVCPEARLIERADVDAIRTAGLGCYVWTVDEPILADRLLGWGVDGIITGRPRLVRAQVDRS